MSNYFLISDLHFGHEKAVTTFTREGTEERLRNFSHVDEMNEYLIDKWNSVVGKNDNVLVLGDVVINKKNMHLVHRLKGSKVLVLGNHDMMPLGDYYEWFRKVQVARDFDGCILTHIPVHESQLEHRWKANVHGHLHDKHLLTKHGKRDNRYYNVSCDCFALDNHTGMNYTPKSWDTIKKEIGI